MEAFAHAFDDAPIGIALVALDGRFFRVNAALCVLLGYSAEELTKLDFQTITHPDDLPTDLELVRALHDGEIPRYKLDKRYIRKDGTIVHICLSASIARSDDGKPLYFIAHIEDVTDQRRAQRALEESEARYRDLFEHASDAVFVADLEGRYTDVNKAGCEMLGYAREELLGKTIVDLLPREDVPRLAASKQYLLTPGHVSIEEWTLLRKDGRPITAEVSACILADRWQAFVRDVTERKKIESALRRTRSMLDNAQRVARMGSWEWNLLTNDVEYSAGMFELFGLPPDRRRRKRWSLAEHVPHEDRERIDRAVTEAIRDRHAYSLEHRIVRADGEERVVLGQGELVYDGEKPVSMVGTVLDITDMKRSQRELEAMHQRLRTVLDECPIGIILVDEGGRHLDVNPMQRRILGRDLDPDQGTAQILDTIRSPDGRPLTRDELPGMRALRGERIENLELQLCRPDGQTIPILVNAAPLPSPTGTNDAVVAIADISVVKELDRLRAEWGAVVAHDLQQPLNAIALQAQLLGRSAGATDAVRRSAEHIGASARRLDRMVRDLMDLSRIDASRLEIIPAPVDIGAVVRSSVDRAKVQFADRRLELHVESGLPTVLADADRLAQVLDNLLGNAVKYGDRTAPIGVDAARTADEISIAVTNRGPAVPPEQLATLFRRFQRTDAAKRSGVKGVGLGLYISRGLVEAHGGRLEAESTEGTTTFRVTLPIAVG
ncbi:MAG: PAS domain S-box protein [Polyangiales bacterium]